MVATLSNQLDKFLIAFFIGLEFLAYYSIGFIVFRQLNTLLIAASRREAHREIHTLIRTTFPSLAETDKPELPDT